MGKVFDIPQCLSEDSSLFWSNHNFWTLAIKNKLLALAFGALNVLGLEVWFRNGCGPNQCFPCLKSLPNFHGKNPTAFHLIFVAEIQQRFTSDASLHTKCYSHQTFGMRIWQWGCPIFTTKIQQSFLFDAPTGRVSHLCIWRISTRSHRDKPKPSKVLEHTDTCHIHGETNVTWWHGSRQSHRNDHAHNIAWICTYGNHLEHIPILQGRELSCIMHNAITQSKKINQTLPTFQGYGLTRYRKCKTNIIIPKERGLSKE